MKIKKNFLESNYAPRLLDFDVNLDLNKGSLKSKVKNHLIQKLYRAYCWKRLCVS